MNKALFSISAFLMMLIGLTACEDDKLYDPSYVGEGDAELTAEITFNSLAQALSRSGVEGGTPGNAIAGIDNVTVVLYSQDGSLVGSYYFSGSDLAISESKDNPADTPSASDPQPGHRAEEQTKKATVKLGKIPYGRYYMYALANVPQSVLTDEVLASAENLKQIELTWNADNIAANSQMFGYFSPDNKSEGFNAPLMTINQPVMKLHAWVKRAVSKVTVAFDGSGLKPGVEIFIKSVAIKDIPLHCYLGAENPTVPDEKIELVNKGQVITFGNDLVDGQYNYTPSWIGYVSADHPINGYNQTIVDNASMSNEDKLKALHGETVPGFYLFENMQGIGQENSMTDKRQQVNDKHREDGVVSYPNGVDPSNEAWKDAKKYGSYIEVKAHYKSDNENEGSGEITYRFMLGKDTKLDYNTERNYHYKLTLRFKGYANDIDWHIDYRKGPDEVLRYPRPFYISYLYGQTAMIPLEFETDEDVTITKVEATIKSNNWAPENCSYKYTEPLDEANPGKGQPSSWWYDHYALYVSYMDQPEARPYNGFLSLRKPKNLLVVTAKAPWTLDVNKSHYETSQGGLGKRTFTGDEVAISKIPLYQSMTEDKLHVERVDRTYYLKVPIWTRARQLVAATGYTGNNPFDAYYRKAIVHVEVTLSNNRVLKSDAEDIVAGNDGKKDVEVRQVRRIVNPKGVWRSKENSDNFHVVLKVLDGVDKTSFADLESDGPWRAYVMHDTDADTETGTGGFVKLAHIDGVGTTSGSTTFDDNGTIKQRETIEGTKGKIDFDITFTGANPSSTPRYAIVRVEYNYNSCYHLIFIRQGYEADDTFGDGNKWCTANNYDQNTLAKNPLDEGSLFRYGNWTQGIKSESNVNGKANWTMIVPNDFASNQGKSLKLVDNTTKDWAAISSKNPSKTTQQFAVPSGMRIAGHSDYAKLVPKDFTNDSEVENFKIKTGYGVLYGDGATETASTIADAYGYKVGGDAKKGMRGCFVYDRTNGKNLFFPIGSSGYGHRRNYNTLNWNGSKVYPSNDNPYRGVLQYSSGARWGYFDAVNKDSYKYGVFSGPLFFDVFRSYGAIYWFPLEVNAKNPNSGNNEDIVGWDINYSTFDFNGIARSNVYVKDGSDACFIRCIEN